MKVKVSFPVTPGSQNYKAVREQLLLDSDGNAGVEKALVDAANSAKGQGQEVYVSRGYTAAGRLSVWIVDPVEPTNTKDRQTRQEALQVALGRVKL